MPESRITPLRGGPVLRWGVLSPGRIAADFVSTLHINTDQRVLAVGSRSSERAQQFAREHGVPRSYGDYRQLVEDPDIDIVYVSSINSEHRALAELAIAAGKHVLIEKPMAVDAEDARSIATAARSAGVFAMEAMWSRYLPQTDVLLQLRDDGVFGELQQVSADFGANFGSNYVAPVFRPELGGGVLRDIGIYPVWFVRLMLGEPESIATHGVGIETGVDAQISAIFSYAHGAQAIVSATMFADTPTVAAINGSQARAEVRSPFLMPDGFDLVTKNSRETWTDSSGLRLRDGLCYQAVGVAEHIAKGLTESPLHSLDDTIAILATLDSMRESVLSA
ncbi:MAG: Gfo/Idh/MocA family oxidoreductase [Pseudolysinimonas sp.]